MDLIFLSMLLMGFVLGLLGGGGSILTVPILFYLFELDAVTATAYSLFIVGAAASVGAFRNYKKSNLDLQVGVLFAIPALLGAFFSRAYLVPNLPSEVLNLGGFTLSKDNFILLIFAFMMLMASYSMIFGRSEAKNSKSKSRLFLSSLGLCVGVATGFVGAGGGFIIIPVLNKFAGLQIKKAMGTSLFIISINAGVGFLGDLISLSPDWVFLFKMTLLAVIGVLVGTSLNSKVPAKFLKKGFGIFVFTLGCWIVYKQL